MKTINIAPYIKELLIFNNPEYCEDESDSCPGINYQEQYRAFSKVTCMNFHDGSDPEELDEDGGRLLKCGQCREVWARAQPVNFTPDVIDKSFPGDDC